MTDVLNIVADALLNALKISGLVVLMMALIELLNIDTGGGVFKRLRGSKAGQVLVSSALGLIPGCMGGFASVSLYTHGIISFGALVAMMIASSGDEAFVMLAMFPQKAWWIFLILFALAVGVGLVVDLVFHPAAPHAICDGDFDIHEEDRTHEHKHRAGHFFKEHIWHHVIVKHLPSVFLWTFGVLLALGFGLHFLDISEWINSNTALMIVLAALVGIIPESGPHLVFVTLYASGIIPLPVLLASCISQDGHASLPLLAESKRGFLNAKLINFVVALAVGFITLLFS